MRQNKIAVLLICFFLGYIAFGRRSYTPEDPIITQDNFLLAASAKTPNDLPPARTWNRLSEPHIDEPPPLFIGFTSNFPLLQQCVVSYLTAGWPASHIYVVDNTGTMLSNQRKNLALQNPHFLNYSRLQDIFEINVISTPTRLSFSQLQNFYLYTALDRGWEYYFWSHMDVVAFSEQVVNGEFQSLYCRAIKDLSSARSIKNWAFRFYSYDRLTLVRVAALDEVGGWDPSILYYPADCDMNRRCEEAGFENPSPHIGQFYDVGDTLADLEDFYHAEPGSWVHTKLMEFFAQRMEKKNRREDRNTWQWMQQGGQNEPYYHGIQRSRWVRDQWNQLGRGIFKYKWGSSSCWPDSRVSWWRQLGLYLGV